MVAQQIEVLEPGEKNDLIVTRHLWESFHRWGDGGEVQVLYGWGDALGFAQLSRMNSL
jgi:hypothetical protein